MDDFVKIPTTKLKEIVSGNESMLPRYYHPFILVRELFWLRITTLTRSLQRIKIQKNNSIVLDLGGEGGIFLPTLSRLFDKVICLDLYTYEANKIKNDYQLNNIQIIQADVLKTIFPVNYFDCIVAADVLEHFQNIQSPVGLIFKWIKPSGHLLLSVPSENWLYVLGRKILRIGKPIDHYSTVKEIEKQLINQGFIIRKKIFLPWYTSLLIFKPITIFEIIDAEKPKL